MIDDVPRRARTVVEENDLPFDRHSGELFLEEPSQRGAPRPSGEDGGVGKAFLTVSADAHHSAFLDDELAHLGVGLKRRPAHEGGGEHGACEPRGAHLCELREPGADMDVGIEARLHLMKLPVGKFLHRDAFFLLPARQRDDDPARRGHGLVVGQETGIVVDEPVVADQRHQATAFSPALP